MKRFFILFIFLLSQNITAQKLLSEKDLSNLANNYLIEGNYVGGLMDNLPNFKQYNFKYNYKISNAKDFIKLIDLKPEQLKGKIIYLQGDFDIYLGNRKNISLPQGLVLYGIGE